MFASLILLHVPIIADTCKLINVVRKNTTLAVSQQLLGVTVIAKPADPHTAEKAKPSSCMRGTMSVIAFETSHLAWQLFYIERLMDTVTCESCLATLPLQSLTPTYDLTAFAYHSICISCW